jgi:hypothetical protein
VTAIICRLAVWLNARLRILATDEESAVYDRIDRELRANGQ